MDENNNNFQQDPDPINNYNQNPNPNGSGNQKEKVVAGILGILLGSLGIHKFYLGYSKEGLIMLLVSLLTCGIGASIMAVIGLIEGILYLTKSDEEFQNTYVYNQKGWF